LYSTTTTAVHPGGHSFASTILRHSFRSSPTSTPFSIAGPSIVALVLISRIFTHSTISSGLLLGLVVVEPAGQTLLASSPRDDLDISSYLFSSELLP
jgi:hypothetical protein